MKRLVVLGSLAGFFAACTPDIPVTAPGTYVTAQFDPSNNVVPTPTILVFDRTANRLNVPLAPGASPAQADFVAFLNSLDGYPEDTPGKVTFSDPGLDLATVTANSVLILDGITGAPIAGASAVLTSPTQISIVPPVTGWPTGRLVAVAVIGGTSANGVKGSGGAQVVGSPTWGLVRSSSPLVTGCTTLFDSTGQPNPDCQPTVSIIPSSEIDPAARLADQRAKAVQLEQLRLLYAPLLNALEAQGIPRENVPIAWTFPVTTRPQVPFDPARNIIPFPNDLVRTNVLPDGGRRVSLPIPDGGTPDIVALYSGLNTLDGFSTTAPIVSVFNADTVGALNQGKLDAGSLVLGTGWGFSRLTGSPAHAPTDAGVTACLDCASSLLADGGTPNHPQRLQFVPNVPLDERTTYGVYLTTKVTDTQGHSVIPSSAFALLRSANPLYDGTKSTVDLITDDQARQLEPLRLALSPFVTNVANAIGGRSNLALAWAFTTQTEVTALALLNALPSGLPPAPFPAEPVFVVPQFPMSQIFSGEIITPEILSGPGGTLDPTNPKPKRVPILVLLPSNSTGCPPTSPYAVTIFGHGLTRSRVDALALANVFTGSPYCRAIIATDVIFHGDRSFCAGSLQFLRTVYPQATSDNDACVVPGGATGHCDTDPSSTTFGRCIALNPPGAACASDPECLNQGQGLCLATGFCEGGDFRRASDRTPLISGWNILNLTNFFATRDNFRQQVVDLAQLTRVIQETMAAGNLSAQLVAAGGAAVDGSRISYVGQSLGGILGTLYTSVATDVHHVVLNVPGGDPTNILLISPSFAVPRAALLTTLAGQGITQGSIAFDTFIGIARWIIDPADPQNMAFSVVHTTMPPDRKALVQYITEDQVVPNSTTEELLRAGDRSGGSFEVCLYHPTDMALPPAERHGFLLNNVDMTTTGAAQTQAATYVSFDTLTPCP